MANLEYSRSPPGIDAPARRRIASKTDASAGYLRDVTGKNMLIFRLGCALAALLTYSVVAIAQDDFPTHFVCDFNQGYSWSYNAGKFSAGQPADLAFEIGDVDLEKQTASLITSTSKQLQRAPGSVAAGRLGRNTTMKNWVAYYDSDHSIYVNGRHRDVHYAGSPMRS